MRLAGWRDAKKQEPKTDLIQPIVIIALGVSKLSLIALPHTWHGLDKAHNYTTTVGMFYSSGVGSPFSTSWNV
jgi:hypothetical protein